MSVQPGSKFVDSSQVYKHPNGSIECKVCLSLHPNHNSYLAHAQGKRHKTNIQLWNKKALPEKELNNINKISKKRKFNGTVKKGIPRYQVQKVRNPETGALGFRVELYVERGNNPVFRIMSTYEQSIEKVNPDYQYVILATESFENIALKIPSKPIDQDSVWDYYSDIEEVYYLQLMFKPL